MTFQNIKAILLVEKIENVLGVFRNYLLHKSVFLRFLIIFYCTVVYIVSLMNVVSVSIGLFQIDSLHGSVNLNMVFLFGQFTESIVIQLTSISYSAKYIEIKDNIKIMIEHFELKSFKTNRKPDIILFFILMLAFISVMIADIVNTIHDNISWTAAILLNILYYASISVHFLQIIMTSILCKTIADVIDLLNIKLREIMNIYKGIELTGYSVDPNDKVKENEMWVIYNKVVFCCKLFTRVFGIQVRHFTEFNLSN